MNECNEEIDIYEKKIIESKDLISKSQETI